MNVTLSLNDELVKKVRKLAVERDTTLTGLLREYLEKLAAEEDSFGRKKKEQEALERSFEELQVRVNKQDWTRAQLYDRG
jgi:hypothetical protein